jgi:hypothetical protein
MTLFLRGAACASLLALVAGCCANSENTCDDLYADSLYLVLKSTPSSSNDTTAFTSAQLDTVYLQRYTPAQPARPNATPPIAAQPEGARSAPVAIVRSQPRTATRLNLRLAATGLTRNSRDSVVVVISNTTPFTPSTAGAKLNAYNYVLTVQDRTTTPRRTYEYVITNIALQGQYEADGCTTCYENTSKSFQITRNSRTRNALATETEKDENGIKIPKLIRISKLD